MIKQKERLESKHSLGALLEDLRDELAHLARTTTQLLRVELDENLRNARSAIRESIVGAGATLLGFLFAFLGIDLLAISLLAPDILSYETAAWISTLSISALLLLAGAVMVKRSKEKLSADKILPRKTLETIEEHADLIAKQAEGIKR